MSKFKQNEFKVQEEIKDGEVRVVKLDAQAAPVISKFEFGDLKKPNEQGYRTVKSRFGSLAATDMERGARKQKDQRFSLSPLLRGPLSIEDEERRVIEEKVKTRVSAVTVEAKTQASKLGYEEGFKKGYEEAFSKYREEGKARLATFESFLKSAEKAKEEIFQANEKFLMEMIFRICRTILLRELTTDREYVLRLAKELIERVGVRENIAIRVSPEDFKSAADLKVDLEMTLGSLKNVNIEPSNQVKGGGCMIETEWNAIDASIDTQLSGLYDSILGGSADDGSGAKA